MIVNAFRYSERVHVRDHKYFLGERVRGQNFRDPIEIAMRDFQRFEVEVVLVSALATGEFLA